MKATKSPGERRKKIQDKFSQHMSVIRMKPRNSISGSNNVEQKENTPFVDYNRSRRSSDNQSQCSQELLCFESLVAMTPASLFSPLEPSPTMRLGQNAYHTCPATPMQGQIPNGIINDMNNFSLNPAGDLTSNYVNYQSCFDLRNFIDDSCFDPVPNMTNTIVTPNPSSQVDMTLRNTVAPTNSYDMPSRPNPPSFIDGPLYLQATPDFVSSFGKADTDNSKFITLEELKVFLQNTDRSSFNDKTALTIMQMFDKNKDFMIDADEFPDMLTYINNWYTCFRYLDSDNSGTINFLEMHNAITCLGLTGLSHDFTANLLKKYVCADCHEIRFDNFILACVTLCRFNEAYKFLESQFGTPGHLPLKLEQFLTLSV